MVYRGDRAEIKVGTRIVGDIDHDAIDAYEQRHDTIVGGQANLQR